MNSEKLSPRQLSAAVMTGGLSAGAAFAGLADWRWLLACVPVGALAGLLLLRRVGRRPMRPVLQVLYGAWGAVLLAGVLERAAGLVQPAYDYALKCSHTFNLLDARGAISVTERQSFIGRVRAMARQCAEAYVQQRGRLGFPMLKDAEQRKLLGLEPLPAGKEGLK